MKILGSQHANLILKPSIDDIKPKNGFDIAKVLSLIGDRYSFESKATLGQSQAGQTLGFVSGRAKVDNKEIPIIRLDIIPDTGLIGLVVNSTEDGDLVLDDLSSALETILGFQNIEKNSERRYISNLVVQFESDVLEFLDKLKGIQKIINGPMKDSLNLKEDLTLGSLKFSFDPALVPVTQQQFLGGFLIEKRANHPYSDNRYFSSAPLKTNIHIGLMQQIADLIGAK